MAQKPADLDYRELQRECKAAGVNAKGCVLAKHELSYALRVAASVQPAAECGACCCAEAQPVAHRQVLWLPARRCMGCATVRVIVL